MTAIDWSRTDAAAQRTLDPHAMAAAVERGISSGDARFNRRLLVRWLLATGLVMALTAAAFVVRASVHSDAVRLVHSQDSSNSSASDSGGSSTTSDPPTTDATRVEEPRITGLIPSEGPTKGGNPVTLTGTGLSDASKVTFGDVTVTDIVNEDGTQLTVTAPPHEEGAVTVTVETPAGTSLAMYTYTEEPPPPPVVTGLEPNYGPPEGSNQVTIKGSGLLGATEVAFGDAIATEIVEVDGTELIVVAPKHDSGTVDVIVTTEGGPSASGSAGSQYEYVAPVEVE